MHTNLVLVLGVQIYVCSVLPISNHCLNIPIPDAVFDYRYMKLFNAKPNVICTFGLRIKQYLTASNIDFSNILVTPLYFILPSFGIEPLKIVLDLVHLKKIVHMQLFILLKKGEIYLAHEMWCNVNACI